MTFRGRPTYSIPTYNDRPPSRPFADRDTDDDVYGRTIPPPRWVTEKERSTVLLRRQGKLQYVKFLFLSPRACFPSKFQGCRNHEKVRVALYASITPSNKGMLYLSRKHPLLHATFCFSREIRGMTSQNRSTTILPKVGRDSNDNPDMPLALVTDNTTNGGVDLDRLVDRVKSGSWRGLLTMY